MSRRFRNFSWVIVGVMSMLLLSDGIAQQDAFEKSYNEQYEKNIKMIRINGVYIPKDIEDAFVELNRLAEPQAIAKFKNASEEEVLTKLHYGLGQWIIKNWNFYDGSRFSHYLKEMEVSHPDDMAQFTMGSWHRHLNNKPLQLEERAREYREKRNKIIMLRDSLEKVGEEKKVTKKQ
jgi:hypothetical protein